MISREEFWVRFGQHVAERRADEKLTQKTFGERLGLSRASIANIESGRQSVSLYTVYLIADILKREIADLMPSPNKIKGRTVQPRRDTRVDLRLSREQINRLSFQERRKLEGLSAKESQWLNKLAKPGWERV